MSGCSGCKYRKVASKQAPAAPTKPEMLIATKSEGKTLVKLRYYGGGMGYSTSGCHACGSSGRYALKTSETIQFASDDAAGGWFSKRFDAGYDYYVTERQAEYLLAQTYTNPSGQVVHKFKKID